MGKLTARSQSGTLNTASVMHAVNDPSGTPASSKETIAAVRTAMTLGAATDLAGGTALTINTAYEDTLAANRVLTFSGTPAEGDRISLKMDVTGATRTLTIPTSKRVSTSGTTTSLDFPVGEHSLTWIYINTAWVLWDSAPSTVTDGWSGIFRTGADDTVNLVQKAPFAGTITSTTTKSASGTATYTFKINTTALGGTANSVSSVESEQAHASANAFVAGDDIVVTRSADATCVDASFTIKYTREI